MVREAAEVRDVGDWKSGAAQECFGRVEATFEDECWQTMSVGTESALQRAVGQTPALSGVSQSPSCSRLIRDAAANVERKGTCPVRCAARGCGLPSHDPRARLSVRLGVGRADIAHQRPGSRPSGPDDQRLVHHCGDATNADAFEHADLCADHKEAFGQPGTVIAATFVADLDRLVVRRAARPIAQVEDRFEPIEAVEELGGAAAAGEKLQQRVGTAPAELVARIHHAPRPRLDVEHRLQVRVQRLVDRLFASDRLSDSGQLSGVHVLSPQAGNDGCGQQWMNESFGAGEGHDGVNLQAVTR